MNGSIVFLLLLVTLAAAAPNQAASEEEKNLDPFPHFHPHWPPFFHHKTTKKPTTTTQEPTTTTKTPTTTTQQTTTKTPTTTTQQTTTTTRKSSTTTKKPSTTTHKTTTTTEETSTKLPLFRGDYERLKHFGYYKIYNRYSSWGFAWSTCFNEGAHLLVLRSQAEYNALQSWKPDYEVPGYSFYGAHHRYSSQEFVTVFDEPLADTGYNKWARDYTSNKTLYNNQDYPDLIVNLHPALGLGEGLLLEYQRSSHFFICKMDI